MRACGALAMTLFTSTSLKTLQEQTIIARLSPGYRVNGSAHGISRADGTRRGPPCFGDVRSTVRVPHCESRGLTSGDSPFYALGHNALFRALDRRPIDGRGHGRTPAVRLILDERGRLLIEAASRYCIGMSDCIWSKVRVTPRGRPIDNCVDLCQPVGGAGSFACGVCAVSERE